MTSPRMHRVADFIREQLAEILRTEMRDPRVSLVSVTDARVSRDLGYADVYVSSLAAEDEAQRRELIRVLNHAAGFLRTLIAKRHSMRTTPRLRFHYDHLIEQGPRMDALIEKTMAESRRDGQAGLASNKAGQAGQASSQAGLAFDEETAAVAVGSEEHGAR